MENSHTLEPLVLRSKGGDKEAFRDLYDIFGDKVFLFIRARSQSRDDALDILQETFIDLWKSLTKFHYSSDGELWSFVYTIASRKASRFYRFKRYTVSLDDIEEVGVEDEKREDIERLLNCLSPTDKYLIRLRYLSGFSISEIANALEKGESAIKVRIHRALEKLKNSIHDEEH